MESFGNPTKNVSTFFSKRKKMITALSVILLLLLPILFQKSGLVLRVFNYIMIYSLIAIGLMIITGYTGMINMGQAAFYGIGGYIAAILATTYNQPWWVCFLAAMLGSGIMGFLLSLPCLKVASDFLSLMTIAFGEIFQTVILNWVSVTRGPMGIPRIPSIEFFGYRLKSSIEYYYLILIILVITYLFAQNIMNSRYGRIFCAIRDDELGAQAQGININRYKVIAFVLGTIPAGMAGALMVHYINFAGHAMFTNDVSLLLMNMIILGGLGSLKGAVFGAAFFVGITELIRPLYIYRVGFGGAIMILVMLFKPQGVFGSIAFAGQGGWMGIINRFRKRRELESNL